MHYIINFIFEHAAHAHWIIFCALILAGFNIPISEDLMIIISAILASSVILQNTIILFAAVFFGAYLSDWMVYWIRRILGIKLWQIIWISTYSKLSNFIFNYFSFNSLHCDIIHIHTRHLANISHFFR